MARPTLDMVYTVGGRAFSQDRFIQTLKDASIDILLDVRWRRAARGAHFAFLNRRRLEALLATAGIRYLSIRALAPSPELRAVQHEIDAANRQTKYGRTSLAPPFIQRYLSEVLDVFDFAKLIREISEHSRRPAMLCLEPSPRSCHRMFAAERLAAAAGCEVRHLD